MDANSRKTLSAILAPVLPTGYTLEEWDDFINYAQPGTTQAHRVLRVVGPGRHLVLFNNLEDPFASQYSRPDCKLMYLNEHGDLRDFDTKAICAAHREATGKVWGWERVIGEWLAANGAMSFTGRGWAEACTRRCMNLVDRWGRFYSGSPTTARRYLQPPGEG